MNLTYFFNKSVFQVFQIGTSFADFEQKFRQHHTLEKHILTVGESYFSCFVNEAEIIFVDKQIVSVEIANVPLFFDVLKSRVQQLTLDKTIEILEMHKIQWGICEKYTKEKIIVLNINDVFYEYKFEENKFMLQVIRLEA